MTLPQTIGTAAIALIAPLTISTALPTETVAPVVVEQVYAEELVQYEPITIQEYARIKVLSTFGVGHWDSYYWLVDHESDWNPLAQNPNTSAFGIGQFLDSTWSLVGCEKSEDPEYQVDCMIEYIRTNGNFSNPVQAKAFWLEKLRECQATALVPENCGGWY